MNDRDLARAAAIDIGTNSVLLAIAARSGAGIVPLCERATITRLGKGVDEQRRLDAAAVERTLSCLEGYAALCAEHGVSAERLQVVGTSALRDASNGAEVIERARSLLGVAPRVISGEEEARLTFEGALSGLTLESGPVTVFDIGGGSTEIIVSTGAGDRAMVSLDVGAVRLTERYVNSDPPTAAELARVAAAVREQLAELTLEPSGALVGVAGTITTLSAIEQRLHSYDSTKVHGSTLGRDRLFALRDELAGCTLGERRELPGLEPKRADVIVSGVCIAAEVLAWSGASELVVSDRGVRWGLLSDLLPG